MPGCPELRSGSTGPPRVETAEGVTDMEKYMTQTSVVPAPRTRVSDVTLAHPSMVGFLGVQRDRVQGDAFGGLRKQPRSNTSDVRIQQINGAYGISVSAELGSPKTEGVVSAAPSAGGVPPRGRPV